MTSSDDEENDFSMRRNTFFREKIETLRDFRVQPMFAERLCRQQRMILNRSYPSLVAAEENLALSMSNNEKIVKNMWIGDTGASVHMCNSLDGLVETRNGVGNIKVGSGKLLKIEKVGKFIGEVMQKNGKT